MFSITTASILLGPSNWPRKLYLAAYWARSLSRYWRRKKKLRYRGYSAPLPRLSTQRNEEEDKKELREEIGETNRRTDDTNKRIVRHIRSLFQQRKIDEINKRTDRVREILLIKNR